MAGWGASRVAAACAPWGAGAAMERELSRDGSHYSISSGILPSLGARSNRRVKLRPFIVSPYDRRYRSAARFPPLRCQFRICSSAQRVLRFICHRASPLPSAAVCGRALGLAFCRIVCFWLADG